LVFRRVARNASRFTSDHESLYCSPWRAPLCSAISNSGMCSGKSRSMTSRIRCSFSSDRNRVRSLSPSAVSPAWPGSSCSDRAPCPSEGERKESLVAVHRGRPPVEFLLAVGKPAAGCTRWHHPSARRTWFPLLQVLRELLAFRGFLRALGVELDRDRLCARFLTAQPAVSVPVADPLKVQGIQPSKLIVGDLTWQGRVTE